jgi:predicted acylesterase/phospholipase RssA
LTTQRGMSRCVSEMCARSLICNKESRGIAAAVSMTNAMDTRPQRVRNIPPFECVALVLQGGGALGAYQAGVFQALAEAGLEPDWIAGISIGAFNSAIIAGNPPEARVEKLRQFGRPSLSPTYDGTRRSRGRARRLPPTLRQHRSRRIFGHSPATWRPC